MTSAAKVRIHPSEEGCCAAGSRLFMGEAAAEALAEVFKALADPTRVRLLRYLAEAESRTACACHLPSELGISQSTLSFHMKKLYEAGLVARETRGKWAHWTVLPEALAGVRRFLSLQGARE